MRNQEEKTMSSTVRAVTDQFVAALEDVMKTAIREQVMAFATLAAGGIVDRTVAAVATQTKAVPAAKRAPAAKRGKTAKRAAPANGGDLDKRRQALWAFIQKNPGARSETIPAPLDVSLLKGMFESGHLRRTGVARGTQYFVTKKALKS